MGKVLIDKLIRSCPGIENIYLLIRKKKGKDIHTRIDELFDDPVMNCLSHIFNVQLHKFFSFLDLILLTSLCSLLI